MLLLCLTLFSNYGLFHCYLPEKDDFGPTPLIERMHKSIHEINALLKDFQLEIRKEKSVLRTVDHELKDIGLLDYSITPVWWGGPPGSLQTGINTTATLFPTPEGHFTNSTKDPWDKFNLPGIQPDYSPSNGLEVLPNHGHIVPDPDYQLDQTPMNPLLTFYSPETSTPYNYLFSAPPTPPSYPIIKPSPSPEPFTNYMNFDMTYSPGSPTFRLPTKILLPPPDFRGPATERGVTISDLYKMMRDRTGHETGGKRLTQANRKTTLPHRPQKLGRTLSKAQAWVRNRQWLKKTVTIRQGNIREGLGNPVENLPVVVAENKPALVENSPDEKAQNIVENAQVEKAPNTNENTQVEKAPVENPPVEKEPNTVDNAQVEKEPNTVEKAPVEKAPNIVENSPIKQPMDSDSLETFSMPALTDIIPSLSIPGLDEVSLTTPATAEDSPTEVDPLAVDTTTTQRAFTEELFLQDDIGFLFVTSPVTIYEPVTQRTTNTLGQILHNAENFTVSTPTTVSYDRFHHLMETRDEGYLIIFFLEFSRLIAEKRPEDVASVLAHAEIIYNKLYEMGTLSFFSEEILELGTKVSRMFSGGNTDILQSHANMMHEMLLGRAEYLSVEVNSIIDYADMLYEDDEGEDLFESLSIFEAFPNVVINSYEVCRDLIETFIRPYRRLRNTERLNKLADSITRVVAKKFGKRRSAGAAATERHHSRKKTKHQPNSLRQRLQIKRYQKNHSRDHRFNRFKRRRQVYTKSLLPATREQMRLNYTTPRQLRWNGYLNMVRPTEQYFKRRLGRPVHPPNKMLQLFPQANKVEHMRRAQISDGEGHHPEESVNQPTLGTMRDEVRRIVEESSYSDEEASLKMNLRHALRVNWHMTSTPT